MQYNHHDEHLHYLQEKISNIQIALFKSEMSSELQLPNNIIQTLKVDDDGTVWFFTSCNIEQPENINRSFYAYLDYYKKGTDCRLQISGRANIVDNEDELLSQSNYSKGTYSKLVLVKMKIMQAEIFESKTQVSISFSERLKNAFHYLFTPPAHRVFDFS